MAAFQSLPVKLKSFLLAYIPVILLLVGYGLGTHQFERPEPAWLAGVVGLAIIFSVWKVELTVFQGQMTMTFAIVCFAMLSSGPLAACSCAVSGALVGSLLSPAAGRFRVRRSKQAPHIIAFNCANCALACLASCLAYNGVRHFSIAGKTPDIPALFAFALTYFLLNTWGVSLAISLQNGERWEKVWQQSFCWTAAGFFASASFAGGVQWTVGILGGRWIHLPLIIPPIYLVYSSYRIYLDRVQLLSEKLKLEMGHIKELNELNQAIIASLATAIDAKDRYTCSHINRVQQYAIALAEGSGASLTEKQAIATGALVHDIGKLGVPDHILGKPDRLTPAEFERVKSHVQIGAEILAPVPFPFPVVETVLSHHERWDGLGYPRGLMGDEIPLGGRVIAIVDVFDALTSDRPYRRALSHEEAMGVLREGAGKHFDPVLVTIFEQVLPAALERIALQEAAGQGRLDGTDVVGSPSAALSAISQAAAEMAAVRGVAHDLAPRDTLEDVLDCVVSRAFDLLPADTVILYLLDEESGGLRAVLARGFEAQRLSGMTIALSEGAVGWVAQNREARVNVAAALDIARRYSPGENIDLTSVTAVPIIHGEVIHGVLAAYTQPYSVITQHHLHLMTILVEHAAIAIQNVRRVERDRELAFTDPLTGLANSRCLIRHLERMTHLRDDDPAASVAGDDIFSVILLDLDGFKQVNDTYGHLRGDDLLRAVSAALTSVARPSDVVSRYAGDEFVMLLPGTGPMMAARVADRIRAAIPDAAARLIGVDVGASVGQASYPDDGRDARTLLNVADERMYQSKFLRRDQLPQSAGTPDRAKPVPLGLLM